MTALLAGTMEGGALSEIRTSAPRHHGDAASRKVLLLRALKAKWGHDWECSQRAGPAGPNDGYAGYCMGRVESARQAFPEALAL